jgi:hypothetical protein
MQIKLVFMRGPQHGHEVVLPARGAPVEFQLGRGRTADLVVADEEVSRRHCAIRVDGWKVEIADHGSANGTFVNDVQISGPSPLKDFDVVKLGSTEIVVTVLATLTDTRAPEPEAGEPATCITCKKPIRGSDVRRGGLQTCAQCRGRRISIPGFRLGRCMGQGAWGCVFEAAGDDGAIVAIKVLEFRTDLDEDDLVRFRREANLLASISHPNIVHVHDSGTLGLDRYLVMERLTGSTLLDQVESSGPLAADKGLGLLGDIARALEYIHGQGIVHRDVKPGNIQILDDGTAKLLDFGLAKEVFGKRTGTTKRGEGLGSIPYMPPEQVFDAANVGPPSDIYGLGSTLYFAMSGREPVFPSGNRIPSFEEVIEIDPIAVDVVNPSVPPFLASIIKKCMKKRPADRYPDAKTILELVKKLLETSIDPGATGIVSI